MTMAAGPVPSTPLTNIEQIKAGTCHCAKPPDDLHGRNIVVCFNGASTNIHVKQHLLDRLDGSDRQLAFVVVDHELPGLEPPKKAGKLSLADLAEVWKVKESILEVYKWLDASFHDGDRIFLFGYGLGALQVQIVAGMLHKVGCGRKWGDDIEEAFNRYRDLASSDGKEPTINLEDKEQVAENNPKAHFIGIWPQWQVERDLFKYRLCCNGTMSSLACTFRRALVLDENEPLTFAPSENYCWVPNDVVDQSVMELWCLNTSKDPDTELLGPIIGEYSNFSSFWMAQEAVNMGLELKQNPEAVWKRDISGGIDGCHSYWRQRNSRPSASMDHSSNLPGSQSSTTPQVVRVILNLVGVSPVRDIAAMEENGTDGSSTVRPVTRRSPSTITIHIHSTVEDVAEQFLNRPMELLQDHHATTQINIYAPSVSIHSVQNSIAVNDPPRSTTSAMRHRASF